MSASTAQAPSPATLLRVVGLARATLEMLREDHGQVIEEDSEILASLAEEGIDVDTVIARLVRCTLDAKAAAAAAKQRASDLAIRQARFEHHEDAYRTTIAQILEALGLKSWRGVEASLSLRPGTAKVVITDAEALGPGYVQTKTVSSPDTTRIRADLEAGTSINGAVLSNPSPVLTIRSK
jgi:hypothetical protein